MGASNWVSAQGSKTTRLSAWLELRNGAAREKVARYKEYVEIVDQLLSNEVTTYTGRYYQVKDAVMNPRPIQSPRPPIVIAGLGPTMLKYAAQKADVWNSLSFSPDFEAQIEETKVLLINSVQRLAGTRLRCGVPT
jgi:alkanesulfonate monooxygenase SsuD/methylene tetrahydromethanopterin reductase-like flavin-dependent oxidoreductase (luciferase family)